MDRAVKSITTFDQSVHGIKSNDKVIHSAPISSGGDFL